jgi:two-component system OmpR family sensor kinase
VGRAAAWAAVQPLIAAIPLLALIIAAVIRRQLWPLRAAVADIAARPPLALSPLPPMRLPNEVQPLVDEINRLLARLREALDHERRFVADAAHALRTPLAALQLQADVLEGVADPVERQARLTELRAGIRRAARLTHHLLALARSDAASTARPVRSDVDEALRNLAESYRSLAAARNVTLSLDLHAGCNVGLDPYDLALAVGNLLDNALRYTAAGGTVLLRTRADDGQAGIDVVDEGPGLPDAELSKVFARFYRAPGDTTGGSGLGLATVKSIVEKAGGEVTLQNRTDRPGLSARLRLPNVGAAVPPLSATAP